MKLKHTTNYVYFYNKKITKKSDENHLLKFKHHQREYAATPRSWQCPHSKLGGPHLMFVKNRTSTTISGSNILA